MTARFAGAFLACALLGTSAFAQRPSSTTHVTGVVVDAHTSTPIRRARVDAGVTETTWSAAFTDEHGAFAVDVPRESNSLMITKAGFAPQRVDVVRRLDVEPAPLQVSLNRAAVITGHLIDASGTPLMNVNVSVRGPAVRNASTNDLGEFRFGGLPAGEYVINWPVPMNPLRVRAGDSLDVGDVVYDKTPPTATVATRVEDPRRRPAIAGTVWDEYGEPVQGAFVHALQIRRVDNRLAALPVDGVSFQSSDDRGSYRVFGLSPGRYLLSANVQGYADAYYSGGTNVAFATPVVVDRADVAGVDFTFRPETAVRVTGRALSSSGQPAVGGVILNVSEHSGAIMTEPKAALLAPDGSFEFDNVPPGDYVVQINTTMAGLRPKVENGRFLQPRIEFGMQRLAITDAAPPPLLIRTTLGATVRGRITAEAPAAPPRLLTVYPFPSDFDQSFAIGSGASGLTRNDDGSFVITGVTGPRRFVLLSQNEDWYLKDARVRGVDAMDTPFDFGLVEKDVDEVEIVVSPNGAAVTGTVTRSSGDTATEYAVVFFSPQQEKWYRNSPGLRLITPAGSPEFRIGGIPPGAYYVIAIDGDSEIVRSGDWQDPATLDKLRSRALRIELAEGEKRTVSLRLSLQP